MNTLISVGNKTGIDIKLWIDEQPHILKLELGVFLEMLTKWRNCQADNSTCPRQVIDHTIYNNLYKSRYRDSAELK